MQLPNDILLEFFMRLSCMAELTKCRRVCKRWKKVIERLGFATVKVFSTNTIYPSHWPDHRKKLNLTECKWLLQACIRHVVIIDLREVMLTSTALQFEGPFEVAQIDDEFLDILYQGSCLKQILVNMNFINKEMWTKLQALGALRRLRM
uniref:F-box domain-containing protein n=1 Tax=Ditylenchus dipsaci TaxID=166011 RepID=A0A915EG35_9BILA